MSESDILIVCRLFERKELSAGSRNLTYHSTFEGEVLSERKRKLKKTQKKPNPNFFLEAAFPREEERRVSAEALRASGILLLLLMALLLLLRGLRI